MGKREFNLLLDDKCPNKSCKKNKLINSSNGSIMCNICGGVWMLDIYSPGDCAFVELKAPKE